jgi:hypothetical protein
MIKENGSVRMERSKRRRAKVLTRCKEKNNKKEKRLQEERYSRVNEVQSVCCNLAGAHLWTKKMALGLRTFVLLETRSRPIVALSKTKNNEPRPQNKVSRLLYLYSY